MRNAIVDRIVHALIARKIIDENDKELYWFGVNQLLLFVINIGTAVLVGLICGMVWQSLLFSLMYIPLRRYAGGYHASNAGLCYWLSTLMILGALMIIKYLEISICAGVVIMVTASIIILVKAPVESPKKPLNNAEKITFRKRTRMILVLEIILTIVAAFLTLQISECIVIAILCSGLMLVLPVKKN